jgi:large subunit ribosomal protein L25
MDRMTLDAQPRTVEGKKVRFMRRNGVIPANLFGHNVESKALQVDEMALERTLARAGKNALVTLNVADGTDARPVLIRSYQRKPTTGKLLHVDLYQVSMTETITTQVPLHFVGTAPGVTLGGVLLRNLDTLQIECLPGDLVSAVEVDLSNLSEIGQAIEVRDLKLSSAIKILSNPETVIAKIMAPEKEEEVAAETTTAEAAAPAEGAAEATE